MCKLAGQLTIIGKQQNASSVAVQTSNWIDTLAASTLHKIHYSLAVLRIITSSNIILWLIEQDVYLLLDANQLVMEKNGIYADMYTKQAKNYLAISEEGGVSA